MGTDLVVATADPTTLVLAEIDARGVAHYHWYIERTTVPGLELEDARRALAPAPDALHVGTLGLTMEPMADSLAALVAEVPAETFVMVDPNCRPTATPDVAAYRERMARVLGRADIVKASDEDLAFLALAATPEASARLLLERGVGAVIVTQRRGGGAGLVRRRRGGGAGAGRGGRGHRRRRRHLRRRLPGPLAGAGAGPRASSPTAIGSRTPSPSPFVPRPSTAPAPAPSHPPARRWGCRRERVADPGYSAAQMLEIGAATIRSPNRYTRGPGVQHHARTNAHPARRGARQSAAPLARRGSIGLDLDRDQPSRRRARRAGRPRGDPAGAHVVAAAGACRDGQLGAQLRRRRRCRAPARAASPSRMTPVDVDPQRGRRCAGSTR